MIRNVLVRSSASVPSDVTVKPAQVHLHRNLRFTPAARTRACVRSSYKAIVSRPIGRRLFGYRDQV